MSQSSPVLDAETLASLRELTSLDQPDFLKSLLTLFTQSAPQRVRVIQASLQSKDLTTIGREAHSLKSSGANIGAMAFSEICQKLEKAARSSDMAAVQTNAPLLQPALDAVLNEISKLPEMK